MGLLLSVGSCELKKGTGRELTTNGNKIKGDSKNCHYCMGIFFYRLCSVKSSNIATGLNRSKEGRVHVDKLPSILEPTIPAPHSA